MRRVLALALPALLAAGPALATGNVDCTAPEGDAAVELVLGNVDVLAVARARIEAAGASWSTDGQGGDPVSVGQAFETDDQMWIDFTDPNVESVVASVRLFKASEGDFVAMAGTLRIAGKGAWAITCFGP